MKGISNKRKVYDDYLPKEVTEAQKTSVQNTSRHIDGNC